MSAPCEVTAKRAAGARLGVFERYLTLWVAPLHRRRHRPRAPRSRASSRRIGAPGDRPGQPAGGGADLADDHPDAAEDRLRARWAQVARALARHRRHAVHQLGGQAVLDGAARPGSSSASCSRRWLPADQIDSYIAGLILLAAAPCTAMVFVWSNLSRRRAALHPQPGGAQRHHHGVRLRADRRAAARPVGDHRAVGHAAAVGGALHRHAGDHRAVLARAGCCARGGEARLQRALLRRLQPGLARARCWPPWCCCSASRASRSWRSR